MERYQFSPAERELLEHSKIPMAIYQFIDKRVATLVLTDGFMDLFGYDDRDEAYHVAETDMYRDTHPDDIARIADIAYKFATEGGRYEVIYRSKNKERTGYNILHGMGEHVIMPDGTRLANVWYTNEGTYVPEGNTDKLGLNRLLNRALHEESILTHSNYDQITGLPSVSYFFDLAAAGIPGIMAKGGNPVILFINFKGMSFFNRRYGFAEGNRLFHAFAKLLGRYFSSDHCSRFAQDHFVAFTEEDGLEEKLERLIAECPGINEGKNIPIHIGIYRVKSADEDMGIACDMAKLACENVKAKGSESAYGYFNENIHSRFERYSYITSNLDRALEERWIEVYYQPIVRAVNGKICDEESLARWIDPELGMLAPSEFIPVLEETGLIYKLDLYMVDRVVEKIRQLMDENRKVVPQSINLSRNDFDACDIVEEIKKRVDSAGIGRDKLTIEITESVIGRDFDFMQEQVERFRENGFAVWMDDFGSGYSSLDVLQSIKFDLIKFDMQFMREFERNASSRVILTELMRLATALGTSTVCEGVETKEQVQFLREIGCSKIQGYYYHKPVPFKQLHDLMKDGNHIGFENPDESEYYDTIGRINLFDLSVIARGQEDSFHHYFSTIPMAIMQVHENMGRFARTNKSFRDFTSRFYGFTPDNEMRDYTPEESGLGQSFVNVLKKLRRTGESRILTTETLPDGSVAHVFVDRVAVNPVNKMVAVVVVILGITEPEDGASFLDIARSLASDYFRLFYVDLSTEKFVEYSSDVGEEEMELEHHGEDFFHTAATVALEQICPESRDDFISSFTREKVVAALDAQGTFSLTYRQFIKGEPTYVNMKVTRMSHNGNFLIVAVGNVDTQMREKQALFEFRQNQVTNNRIMALMENCICFYVVDIKTEDFTEFSASEDFRSLGIEGKGAKFFETSHRNARAVLHPDDVKNYIEKLTKENILYQIKENGMFSLRYRLIIDGREVPVLLKANIVKEAEGDKLIFGTMRQEQLK